MGAAQGTSEGSLPGAASPRLSRLVVALAVCVVCAVSLALASSAPAGVAPRVAPAALASLSISAQAAPATIALGTGFVDTATLTPPAGGPAPSGTISFSVYGPTDPGCMGPVLFDSTNTLAGATTPSGSFTPPDTGTYRVIATYSGDTNYASASTVCGDPADSVTVGLRPTLTALSPGSGPAGGGTAVTITGTNLSGATTVDFGGVAAAPSTLSATEVVAAAPAGTGTVNVTVMTPFGTTATGSADLYTYAAAASSGPPPNLTPVLAAQQLPIAKTGSTRQITPSSAVFTATVDPDGLPTSAQFEYTVRLPGGLAITARTPQLPVGSDLASHTVTASVTGLLADSHYRVRIQATNASGTTVATAITFATPSAPAPPPPVLGRTFTATPVSGIVELRLPGAGQPVTPLTDARQLPVGTTFDTRHGVARLTTATPTTGHDQSGSFGGATFTVLQSRADGGLAELRLVRASTTRRICAAGPATSALEVLHATTTGRFETRARYGSATGGRATWTTTDRCDGLLAAVTHGVVDVDDFATGRTVAVSAGHSDLVKAH